MPAHGVASPARGVIAPSAGMATPSPGVVSPDGFFITTTAGEPICRSVAASPGVRMASPATGVASPSAKLASRGRGEMGYRLGVATPRAGDVHAVSRRGYAVAGVPTPTAGVPSPTAGEPTPMPGVPAPLGGIITPRSRHPYAAGRRGYGYGVFAKLLGRDGRVQEVSNGPRLPGEVGLHGWVSS